jgi:hypothetical protein
MYRLTVSFILTADFYWSVCSLFAVCLQSVFSVFTVCFQCVFSLFSVCFQSVFVSRGPMSAVHVYPIYLQAVICLPRGHICGHASVTFGHSAVGSDHFPAYLLNLRLCRARMLDDGYWEALQGSRQEFELIIIITNMLMQLKLQ